MTIGTRGKSGLLVLGLLFGLACPQGRGTTRAGEPSPASPDPADAAAAEVLRAVIAGSGPSLRRPTDPADFHDSLSALYGPEAEPRWTRAGRPAARAAAAIEVLRQAGADGLRPGDYDTDALDRQLVALATGRPAAPAEVASFDARLSVELLRLLGDLHHGRVPPARVGFAYPVDPEAGERGRQLRQVQDQAGLATLVASQRPAYPQYERLRRILARSRSQDCDAPLTARHARQIELALERLRWLPHPVSGPFLVANIPAFRLVAFRSVTDEVPELQMPIVVGRAARTQTPLFADEVTSVIFRPFWYPPASIIRKEILPAVARDPGYLAHEQMEVVARTGDTTALAPTPANLSLLRAGRVTLRQRPGPGNALGLVKFVFPNDYDVYMHDTPAQALFARGRRDFSHGCIRVARPRDLAAFVLSGQPAWTAERIAASMAGTQTVRVRVEPPIPVFIFYTTAIVRADRTVEFFDDVYGLDARLEQELGAAGRAP